MPKAELLIPEDGGGCVNGADGDLCSASEMSTCVTASTPDLDKSRPKEELTRKLTSDHTVRTVCRNLTQLLETNAIAKAFQEAREEQDRVTRSFTTPAVLCKEECIVNRELEFSKAEAEPAVKVEEGLSRERLAEEQLKAERSKVERLTAECAAAERLASERLVAERRAAERLAQVEAREALCEKQVAADRRHAAELAAELEKTRREVDAKRKELESAGQVVKELRARETQMMSHAQSLESLHQDAKQQVETFAFQNHLLEVDLHRNKAQLDSAVDRHGVLEDQLQMLQTPMAVPEAAKQAARKTPALLARHGMASRASYEQTNGGRSQPMVPTREPPGSPKKQPNSGSQSLFWGCCSASAPEKPATLDAR